MPPQSFARRIALRNGRKRRAHPYLVKRTGLAIPLTGYKCGASSGSTSRRIGGRQWRMKKKRGKSNIGRHNSAIVQCSTRGCYQVNTLVSRRIRCKKAGAAHGIRAHPALERIPRNSYGACDCWLRRYVPPCSSKRSTRIRPSEWNDPPVAVRASLTAFGGSACITSPTCPVAVRVFST